MVELIVIVPYRDREQHKFYFLRHMEYILEDYDYEILFVHQKDNRPFNRGAMKNIGFLYCKEKYYNYKDITFVFHDIDTLPYKKNLLNYNTEKNVIKHFYGFTFCLGGIFSIKGEDFEKTNGFPSFWTWGYEDNVIYRRAIMKNIIVNRDNFYTIGNMNILHFVDGLNRLVSKGRPTIKNIEEVRDGLDTLQNIKYEINDTMLDVTNFVCSFNINHNVEQIHVLKQTKPGIKPNTLGKMFF